MKFGAITNSWREYLASASIDALVGEAAAGEIEGIIERERARERRPLAGMSGRRTPATD